MTKLEKPEVPIALTAQKTRAIYICGCTINNCLSATQLNEFALELGAVVKITSGKTECRDWNLQSFVVGKQDML